MHPFEFPLDLPGRGSRQRLQALHTQLRAAILDGRLKSGLRLPATRELAVALGLSRNTVVAAYERLLSEGYIEPRRGAGHFVAALGAPRTGTPVDGAGVAHRLAVPWRAAHVASPAAPALAYDFRLGSPDPGLFPFDVWRRLSMRAWRNAARTALGYDAPQGRRALREAIARHVAFARAVACGADDVVVTCGAQQAFDLLARVLVTPGRTVVAVEDPGYPPLRDAFAAAGARVVGVPVDAEGLQVERLPAQARVVYVTPSHQFPLGVTLSPQRRAALLDFARTHGATVIEDDYDSEFRYGQRPLEALQTLDRSGSVCYVGTFSKCLFPSLRLGYAVAPPWLRPALVRARQLADGHGDPVAQETLAAFIAEGHLARHVRRMRRVYAQRREQLLQALARHGRGRLDVWPSGAGLHLAATLPREREAARVAALAAREDIQLEALDGYALGRVPPNGLAFGYGRVEAADIDAAVRRLARLLD
ncbi:PLP-dependent aminotransferase family protein [Fulvimonas yonginensis]|uniref:PLP-dependent aminotransferase family protein n=1 Tax=Fulvimonas yonginensis TaxID=1495200 RepID=A0ABU8JC86_9GAMM